MFSADEIKMAVERTLNSNRVMIPDGHKGAFVVFVDNMGVRTALAFKTGNDWEILGEIGYHPHANGLEFGVNVMKSW